LEIGRGPPTPANSSARRRTRPKVRRAFGPSPASLSETAT
jgi:hypothetical protein